VKEKQCKNKNANKNLAKRKNEPRKRLGQNDKIALTVA